MAEDWYLVANKNSLTIKIRDSVTLGEGPDGLLVLDSRVEAERWVTLEIDPKGCLNVVHQAPGCRLECPGRWVMDTAGAIVPRCTMVELPNNHVYVSQHLQRGKVESRVVVTHSDSLPPLEVTPVPEAVPVAKQPRPSSQPTDLEQKRTEQTEPESQDALEAALNEVVLTRDVLEEMLSALEAQDNRSEQASTKIESRTTATAGATKTKTKTKTKTEADITEPAGTVFEDPDATLTNEKTVQLVDSGLAGKVPRHQGPKPTNPSEDIPLLQDVANIFVAEVTLEDTREAELAKLEKKRLREKRLKEKRLQEKRALDEKREAQRRQERERERQQSKARRREEQHGATQQAPAQSQPVGDGRHPANDASGGNSTRVKPAAQTAPVHRDQTVINTAARSRRQGKVEPGISKPRTAHERALAAEAAALAMEAKDHRRSRRSITVASALVLLVCAVTFWLLSTSEPTQDIETAGFSNLADPILSAPSALHRPVSEGVTQPVAPPVTPPVTRPIEPQPVVLPQPELVQTPAPTAPQVQIGRQIVEAKSLIAQGYLTWPEDNAVAVLQQVLTLDPAHPEALQLLDQAAYLLILQAEKANADGFVDGARAVVDDILSFHPGYQAALELKASWQ